MESPLNICKWYYNGTSLQKHCIILRIKHALLLHVNVHVSNVSNKHRLYVLPSLPHTRIARSPPHDASSVPAGFQATYQQRASGCALTLCSSSSAFIPIWLCDINYDIIYKELSVPILSFRCVYQILPTSCSVLYWFLLMMQMSIATPSGREL